MKLFSVKRFDFLIALYVFCIIASELMGGKTFPIATIGSFHLNGSVAIFLVPIVYAIDDMVTEVYGLARARSIVRSGLFMVVLLLLFSLLAISLPPSTRFISQEHSYEEVFSVSARIAAASLTAFALGEFAEIFIFYKIRKRMGKKGLWLRNNVSNFIAEFVDTSVFMTLAFYALNRGFGDNAAFLVSLILPYWLLKCFMSLLETPFVYLGVSWLKKTKEE